MTVRADDARVDIDGDVMIITINRPAQRNAMTQEAARVMATALNELDTNAQVAVAILTGAGGTFCAGMDLKRFAAGELPRVEGRGFGGLTEAPPVKPLIAAVEGWALGGGFELVLAADLVVAGRSAKFGLPEVKRGLLARGGGAVRLPRRVPQAIALQLLLTGDPIDATEARNFGLINHVVDDGMALAGARAMAASIAPLSVTCRSPRASTIAAGASPVSTIASNTSLAMRPLIVPSAIRSRSAPR
jgi:enoyl-CoA hydratase